jgi:hypothetical protein
LDVDVPRLADIEELADLGLAIHPSSQRSYGGVATGVGDQRGQLPMEGGVPGGEGGQQLAQLPNACLVVRVAFNFGQGTLGLPMAGYRAAYQRHQAAHAHPGGLPGLAAEGLQGLGGQQRGRSDGCRLDRPHRAPQLGEVSDRPVTHACNHVHPRPAKQA